MALITTASNEQCLSLLVVDSDCKLCQSGRRQLLETLVTARADMWVLAKAAPSAHDVENLIKRKDVDSMLIQLCVPTRRVVRSDCWYLC